MKTLLTIILLSFLFTSCTSEYEERLEEGKDLLQRIEFINDSQNQLSDDTIKDEMTSINNELSILAKVSGNEELFLDQLKNF